MVEGVRNQRSSERPCRVFTIPWDHVRKLRYTEIILVGCCMGKGDISHIHLFVPLFN